MTEHLEMAIGSRTIEANGVELYPSSAVAEWRGLMVLAQQQLGGVSTGFGFLGSPGWAIGGALALGVLESALSTAKAKEGFKTLERAAVVFESLRSAGKIFPIHDVQHVGEPVPANWIGSGRGKRKVEMGKIGMLDRGRFLRDHDMTKADVVDGVVEIDDVVPFSSLGEEFLKFATTDGHCVQVRWTSVDAVRIVRER